MGNVVVPISNAGQYGIIREIPAQELPLNAWSDGANFRFQNGYAERIGGHSAAFGTPTVAPYYLAPVPSPVAYFWVYASLTKLYAYDGAAHTDLTRAVGGNYNANADDNWTHAILGGVPVFNNSSDAPQMWLPVSLVQKFQALSNWPAATTCKALRAFKYYLVAMDLLKAGTRYPQMIKWSHPADPGTVPTSWNEADPTKDAGEYSLTETPDFVLDSAPLRDVNIIYKESTTWGMQFVGGIDIFKFYNIFNTVGSLSRRCAQEFFSGVHAVFGNDDIYQHNGQSATSILTRKLRRSVFSKIDPTSYVRSFTAVNFAQREMWFCFPENGQSFPTLAVVWNWDDNTVGFRDIPMAAHIASGVSNEGAAADSWAADAAAWSTDSTIWDARLYNPTNRNLFMGVPGIPLIYQADNTNQFAGADYTSFLERTGLGIPMRANEPPDISQVKYVTRIFPRIQGDTDGVVHVQLGGQMDINGPVTYQPAKDYIIGTTKYLDFRVSAKLFAVKFTIDSAINAKVDGYELEVRKAGIR